MSIKLLLLSSMQDGMGSLKWNSWYKLRRACGGLMEPTGQASNITSKFTSPPFAEVGTTLGFATFAEGCYFLLAKASAV